MICYPTCTYIPCFVSQKVAEKVLTGLLLPGRGPQEADIDKDLQLDVGQDHLEIAIDQDHHKVGRYILSKYQYYY